MKLHFTCFYAHIGKEKSWSRAFLVAVNSLFKVDSAKSFFVWRLRPFVGRHQSFPPLRIYVKIIDSQGS